jgi:tyrosinase
MADSSLDRPVTTGSVKPSVNVRLEINDFVKNDYHFSLYVMALRSFFEKDEPDFRSYFGVAGIHGRPYIPWGGAKGQSQWAFGGYCVHGSVLFPTWHRPYLALFEQLIQQNAMVHAQLHTVDTGGWAKAALDLRLPYWGWEKGTVLPDVIIDSPTVTITDYSGKKVQVDNPFMRYRFRAKPLPLGPRFSQWGTTLRHPDSNGKENIPELKQSLSSMQSQVTQDVLALLQTVHDWPSFSNHTDTSGSHTNSLEAIHDYIHVAVGANGHMGSPDVAAYDPIFWMHHANVDRLISLWSAQNPTVKVNQEVNHGSNFTLAANAILNENTDLSPFWDTASTFWTSKKLGDYAHSDLFAYTYPSFSTVDRTQPTQVKAAAATATNTLLAQSPRNIFNIHADRDDIGQWNNWTARIRCKKFEIGRSFSVLLFLGEVPQDHHHWKSCDNLVGIHHVFVNAAAEECENCSSNNEKINEGFVHLNMHILRKKPEYAKFEHDAVKPYLTENLHWRTIDMVNEPVQIQTLEVTVISVLFSKVSHSMFPALGERLLHLGITLGRHGGATDQTRN